MRLLLLLSFISVCQCDTSSNSILNKIDITFYNSLTTCQNNSNPIAVLNKSFPTDCGCMSFTRCLDRLHLDKLYIEVYKDKIQIDSLDYNRGCVQWGDYYYNYHFNLYYRCLIDLVMILGLIIVIICFCGCIFVIHDNDILKRLRFNRYKKETVPNYRSINIINN